MTAAGAIVHALRALNTTKIGFASPYVDAINELAVAFFAETGIETVERAGISRDLGNYDQGQLTPDEVYELGLQANGPDVEAVVLSCTDMRSVEIVDRLEAKLNKPVVTSNQAMLFQALRQLEMDVDEVRCGCLFRKLRLI